MDQSQQTFQVHPSVKAMPRNVFQRPQNLRYFLFSDPFLASLFSFYYLLMCHMVISQVSLGPFDPEPVIEKWLLVLANNSFHLASILSTKFRWVFCDWCLCKLVRFISLWQQCICCGISENNKEGQRFWSLHWIPGKKTFGAS